MPDREKVIRLIEEEISVCESVDQCYRTIDLPALRDILALLKEQDSLLGVQQTADRITFISTGTAKQGEERGILLGKSLMHEWIYKELLYKGLLTDDIRSVFEQAKRI